MNLTKYFKFWGSRPIEGRTGYYKVLANRRNFKNRSPFAYMDYTAYLPTKATAGRELPKVREQLWLCVYGYHWCTDKSLQYWSGPLSFHDVYIAEPSSDVHCEIGSSHLGLCNDKCVSSGGRLIRKLSHREVRQLIKEERTQ